MDKVISPKIIYFFEKTRMEYITNGKCASQYKVYQGRTTSSEQYLQGKMKKIYNKERNY